MRAWDSLSPPLASCLLLARAATVLTMTQPQAVLVPGAAPTRATRSTSPATVAEGPNVGRRVLAALGLTFLVVGLTDLVLAWYPLVCSGTPSGSSAP